MTHSEAAYILEPLWLAVEVALDRLSQAEPDDRGIHQQAERFLVEVSRRFDASNIDGLAWLTPTGREVFWPVMVGQKDQAAAINRWLDRTPEVKARRDAKRAAYLAALEAAGR